jgi:intein/homing endonuclease
MSELPSNFRVALKEPFLQQLLLAGKNKVGSWKNLAKELKLDYTALVNIKNGKTKSISLIAVRTLVALIGTTLETIERNCVHVVRSNGKPIKVPIRPTPKLASLVAHALGDGSIGEKNLQVEFKNKSPECLQDVIDATQSIFNIEVRLRKDTSGFPVVFLPASVGQVLLLAGAAQGDKTKKDFDVPQWIKDGDIEIKKAFLRALFDDEGSVDMWSKWRNIKFAMGKSESRGESLRKFLNSIRSMLRDFEINAQKVRIWRRYKVSGEKNKLILGFWITGKHNLKFFAQRIGFKHVGKQRKLIEMLSTFKHAIYDEEIKDEIVRILIQNGPRKTRELSEIIGKDRSLILKHLHKLKTIGKVSFFEYKSRKRFPGFLWYLKENPGGE